MVFSTYLISNYLTISIAYLCHYLDKGRFDFQAFALLYFIMVILYYSESKLKINHYKKQSKLYLTILYLLIVLTYVKHIKNKQDSDYIYLGLLSLLIAIIKYNDLSERGKKELSCNSMINITTILGISALFAKHAIIHDDYDYLLIGGLYLLHTATESKLDGH